MAPERADEEKPRPRKKAAAAKGPGTDEEARAGKPGREKPAAAKPASGRKPAARKPAPGRKPAARKPARRRSRPRAPKVHALRLGEAIYGASAVALFVTMFVPWFGSEYPGQRDAVVIEDLGGSAWDCLQVIPLILMLTIAVAVGAVILRLIGSEWRPAVAPGAAVAVLGGISTLLILLRILVPPDLGTIGGLSVDATLKLGVFLGLVFAAGIAYGGYRAMGEEGASFAAVAERLAPSR